MADLFPNHDPIPNHDPTLPRCQWVPQDDPLYCAYHDEEWGRPIFDPKLLFSKLIQDGQQAGLAWITILRKRETLLQAYDGFDPDIIAHYSQADIARLLANPGVIRSPRKITATIGNARAFLQMRSEGIDFSDYLWSFVGGAPIQNAWTHIQDVPVKTEISEALSKDLKKHGFKYVGPVILYAFMQAVGMVNDHTTDCHCYAPCRDHRRL